MKKQLTFMSVAILSAALLFTSCKKETTTDNTKYNETELAVQSDDQAMVSNESDFADNDAMAALENSGGSFAGNRPLTPPVGVSCDATVVYDTTGDNRTITITYSGNCLGRRSRTGSVVISFAPGFRWARAGAHHSITYNNLKITRLLDNKSITINGTRTITNVSGGRLVNLASLGTIIHTVSSDNMSITFDNGSQRTWNVARKRTFTYDNGVVTAITGNAPASVGTGVAEWGTNRFGRDFKTAILQPLVVKQDCDFRLVSGQTQHTGYYATTTTTFGLDAAGNPITTCPTGPFFLKIVWTGANGQTRDVIRPY